MTTVKNNKPAQGGAPAAKSAVGGEEEEEEESTSAPLARPPAQSGTTRPPGDAVEKMLPFSASNHDGVALASVEVNTDVPDKFDKWPQNIQSIFKHIANNHNDKSRRVYGVLSLETTTIAGLNQTVHFASISGLDANNNDGKLCKNPSKFKRNMDIPKVALTDKSLIVNYCEVGSNRACYAGLTFPEVDYWADENLQKRRVFVKCLRKRWRQFDAEKVTHEQKISGIEDYFQNLIFGPFLAKFYNDQKEQKADRRTLAETFASKSKRKKLLLRLKVTPSLLTDKLSEQKINSLLRELDSKVIKELGIEDWKTGNPAAKSMTAGGGIASNDNADSTWYAFSPEANKILFKKLIEYSRDHRNAPKKLQKQLLYISDLCGPIPDMLSFANFFCRCAEDNAVIAMGGYLEKEKKKVQFKKVVATWYSVTISETKDVVYEPLCGVCALIFRPRTIQVIKRTAMDLK